MANNCCCTSIYNAGCIGHCDGLTVSGLTGETITVLIESGSRQWTQTLAIVDGAATVTAFNEEAIHIVKFPEPIEINGETYDCIKVKTEITTNSTGGGGPQNQTFCELVAACGGTGGNGSTPITLPDYINIQRLDPINPQSLSDGDRVIWGGYVWENQSGGAVTPTIVDEFELTGVVKLPRVVGDGYFSLQGYLETAAEIGEPNMVTRLRLPILNHLFSLGFVTQDASYLDPYTTMIGYVFGQNLDLAYDDVIGQPKGIISNRLGAISEIRQAEVRQNGGGGNMYKVDGFAKVVNNDVGGQINDIHGGVIDGNVLYETGKIQTIYGSDKLSIKGNELTGVIDGVTAQSGFAFIEDNIVSDPDASINSLNINYGRVIGNTLSGGSVNVGESGSQIAWCNLNDNCEINGNVLSGDFSVMWDIHALENSKVNDNILSGELARISALQMQDNDEVIGNELNGLGAQISIVNMIGNNQLNGNILGQGGRITEIQMRGSKIINNDFSFAATGIFRAEMKGAQIKNAKDILIERIDIAGIIWDLTGYTNDIRGHFYSNGLGNFQQSFPDGTTGGAIVSLQEDLSRSYNIVPIGHRVVRLFAKGNGITATDPSTVLEFTVGGELLATATLAQLNAADGVIAPSNIGQVMTSNSPLILTARNGSITGGTMVVTLEYVKGS
jgi:hypothetical protein